MPILNDTIPGMMLTALGYLSVGVFFFLSGYGLQVSYDRKGQNYIKSFPKQRILPFYCICVLSIILYLLYHLFTNTVVWSDVVQSFVFGKTIIANGWYLQSILLIYILFYLSYKLIEQGLNKAVVWLLAGTIYFALSLGLGSSIMVESVMCFPLGMLVATYRDRADVIIKKWWIAIPVFIVFAVTLIIGSRGIIPCKMLASCSFTILVLYAISIIPIKNKATEWLSGIYLELYVIQGMVLEVTRPWVSNDWEYALIAVIGSIGFAWLLHPVYQFVMRKAKTL